MKHFTTCVSVMFIAGLLSGCGGGRGSFDKDAAIRLTGSSAPKETFADQAARDDAIGERSDGLVAAVYGETDNPDVPPFAGRCREAQNTCRIRVPLLANPITVSVADGGGIEANTDSSTEVLTRNDITLFEARGGVLGENYRLYGAWMEHAAFGVATNAQVTTPDGSRLTFRGPTAGGDVTGSRPSGDATWRGVMVGTPVRGDLRDNILQGDAELTYRASDAEIDARFSNITDLDRQAPHSASEVLFDGVPVEENGTYSSGAAGNRISGGFAGPDHAESAGIFEQKGIVGSFGAKRQK